MLRLLAITATLAVATGCLQLRLEEPLGPVAVEATFDVVATNRRLQCEGFGFDTRCVFASADILSITADREVFEPRGDALLAVAPGRDQVKIRARVGRRVVSRGLKLEAAHAAEVFALAPAGYEIDRILLEPGSRVGLGWRALDARGRELVGRDFPAWSDPSGALGVELAGSALDLVAPDASIADVTLIGIAGDDVATVRVAPATLDAIEVVVEDTWGDALAVRVMGWDADFAVLGADLVASVVSSTPDVCVGEAAVPVGEVALLEILGPGVCAVQARVEGVDALLEASASARVAPAIPRAAP